MLIFRVKSLGRAIRLALEEGGRWLLKWFILSEPDWQTRHIVYLTRCWPIGLEKTKHERCSGDFEMGINDFIRDYRDQIHPGDAPMFPYDFPDLSMDQWEEIVSKFRGCCGERLRHPDDAHWPGECGH